MRYSILLFMLFSNLAVAGVDLVKVDKSENKMYLLGPVNTMRISIDGDHFFTGQGALSAVYLPYISESATQSWGKMVPSLRVGSQMRPCGVAHRLFGATKSHSARLAWPHLRANAGYPHSVNRP